MVFGEDEVVNEVVIESRGPVVVMVVAVLIVRVLINEPGEVDETSRVVWACKGLG